MGEGDVTKVICKARSVIYLKGFLRLKKKKKLLKKQFYPKFCKNHLLKKVYQTKIKVWKLKTIDKDSTISLCVCSTSISNRKIQMIVDCSLSLSSSYFI